MCEELRRRIDEYYLPDSVKNWWYSLTEAQRAYWIHRAEEERRRLAMNSRTKQTL